MHAAPRSRRAAVTPRSRLPAPACTKASLRSSLFTAHHSNAVLPPCNGCERHPRPWASRASHAWATRCRGDEAEEEEEEEGVQPSPGPGAEVSSPPRLLAPSSAQHPVHPSHLNKCYLPNPTRKIKNKTVIEAVWRRFNWGQATRAGCCCHLQRSPRAVAAAPGGPRAPDPALGGSQALAGQDEGQHAAWAPSPAPHAEPLLQTPYSPRTISSITQELAKIPPNK